MLQSWLGLAQMLEKSKARMTLSQEIDTLMPHDLINAKPHAAAMLRWFEEGPTSRRLDTTNPLASLSQLRRVQTTEGFEPHHTHRGRISQGELALACSQDELGFLTAPYQRLIDGQASGQGGDSGIARRAIERLEAGRSTQALA